MTLTVVTASTDPLRAQGCLESWQADSCVIVVNGKPDFSPPDATSLDLEAHWIVAKDYLGTVPAFKVGVDYTLEHTKADVIACLHDDVQILDPDWASKVLRHFERHPACGLLGFSGAIGLGDADIYQKPYSAMQLARVGFRSNLVDAEVHGLRSLLPEQVACNDGFSLIGRRDFFDGIRRASGREEDRPFTYFADHGLVHHCYDSLCGAYAKRLGWECWYLPISCRHFGGQTAVGDAGYQKWAAEQIPGGDQGFWEQSHKRGYELFKDQLPIRV